MAAPFASRTTITIAVPFDPPNEVTIRKLAGRHLERARVAFMSRLVREIQQRGGAAVQRDMESLFSAPAAGDAGAPEVRAVKLDPLNGFDKYVLCSAGIVKWTYPEPLALEDAIDEDGHPVRRIAAIYDLEDEALVFFATEVLRLTKPTLFQSAAEAAETRKND